MARPELEADGKLPFKYLKGIPMANFAFTGGNQVTGGVTSENLILLDTEGIKQYIIHSTVTNSSRMQVMYAGTYRFSLTAIVKSSAANKTVEIYAKVNGTIAANSGIHQSTSNTADGVLTRTFLVTLAANDFVEFAWCSRDDASMLLETNAGGVSPTTPTQPCVAINVQLLSF